MKLSTYKNSKYKILSICFLIGILILIIPLHIRKEIRKLPETGDILQLNIEMAVEQNNIQRDDPTEGSQNIHYTITVRNEAECAQIPVDTILVFDKSGSMRDLISDAKQAGITFIDRLDFAEDQAGIVTYNETAFLNQTLTNSQTDLVNAINSIYASGMTNIGDGIETATNELTSSRHNTAATPVIIIFTDGRANRPGNVNPRQYTIKKATEAKDAGIRIISIAYGTYADQDLMQQIASPGIDNYFWAETGIDMIRIYQAIAENLQGDSPDTQVSIDLSHIENIIDLESISSGGSLAYGELNWNLGTLQCQETAFLEFSLNVNNNARDLDIIDIIASATNSTGDTADSLNAVTTIHAPNFNIYKTDHQDEVMPGDHLDYIIEIQNLGTGNAYDVTVKDILPNEYFNLTYNSISNNGYIDENEEIITWDNEENGYVLDGSFQPIEEGWSNSLSLNFSGEVDENLDAGIYTLLNTVQLETANDYTQEAFDKTDVPYAPDLSITKQSDPPLYTYPEGELIYTLTIANNGNLDAHDITIRDDYDESNMSVNPNEGFVQNGIITWEVDELKIGESQMITYTALINDVINGNNVTIPNESVISSTEPDINEANNIALHEVIVTLVPVLTISKTSNKTTYEIDEEIEYTINIANHSNADAYNVTLEDAIPLEFDYREGSAKFNGEIYNNPQGTNTLIWDLGNLLIDQSIEFVFKLKPNDNCSEGNYINPATITWNNRNGEQQDPQSANCTISVVSGTSISETIDSSKHDSANTTQGENTILGNVLHWTNILSGSLVKAGEALVYLKTLLGFGLALPLPLMLLFESKQKSKKFSKSRKRRIKKRKK